MKFWSSNSSKVRVLGLSAVICGAFCLLIVKFFTLQVAENAKWKEVARRQHTFTTLEPAHRGAFFANGAVQKTHPERQVPLVVEVQKFHLHVDPASLPEPLHSSIAEGLRQVLGLDEAAVLKELGRSGRDRKVAEWIDHRQKDAVMSWWTPFAREHHLARNALFFSGDFKREHPGGFLLGQVLHTVQKRRDEATGKAFPTGGLELAFNETLHARYGKKRYLRSPRNALEIGEVVEEPQKGEDVYLTINDVLQTICEEELEKGVKRANGKSGWAVMMHPETGEILALAQYPFYDLEEYSSYFNNPELIEQTKLHPLTDAFEPGSVMKPLAMVAALMANEELLRKGGKKLFDPEEKIASLDGTFPGRKKPITDVRPHKFLNMDMALQKSTNIYMGRVTDRVIQALGPEWYYKVWSDTFALSKKSGIELPGESEGLLPKPGRTYANGKLQWSVPTPYSLAIGYNLQINSFQLLRAWALLANRGALVYPTLLKGKGVRKEQVVPYPIVDRVVEGMRYCSLPGGTSTRADVPGFTEVGKSGTSRKIVNGEYSRQKHVVSFIGFAPHDNPEFVLLVMIDEPEVKYIPGVGANNHGGAAAAPIFREIALRSLEYLGLPPNDPYGYPQGDPRSDPSKAAWRAQSRRLQEKYKSWNN
ncbi:MAG: penicillin-binding protein 2 [Chlamydiia bacterium]|nr:penicillin-binding protein 2 [Chlamydiia bacterium]